MRLLSTGRSGKLVLTEFPNETIPPPYAILSHTWAKDEVTFEEIQNQCYKGKSGYRKIQFCAEQARRDDLEYFWVDTCCINKAHLTELSESINRMFDWYSRAEKCYVYLNDVPSSSKRICDSDVQIWRSRFKDSRWFKRGWTLQELLAPTSVEFFSEEGRLIGKKSELISLLSEITTIPSSVLQGAQLEDSAVLERMQWAAGRETTKPEDRAYCLLGIFQVSMLPNYGEGIDKAMFRLKEEINKRHMNQLLSIGHSWPKSGLSAPTSSTSASSQEEQLQKYRIEILESLDFAQMDNRRETIQSAYSNTCSWLLCHSAYMDWLDPQKYAQHNGFLWIKGKPGAGKSTLVKYAFQQAGKSPENHKILLSYFFNARGDVLEKSTSGMYRSLLCQLLPKIDNVQKIFDGVIPSYSWRIDRLRELFTSALRQLQGQFIECYIDALDECDEQEVRDMIAHFKSLGQVSNDRTSGGRFCVCLASRHYPSIVVSHGDGIQLILEDEPGHREDLAMYIRKHLKIGKNVRVCEELETRVHQKANSVFMWAVLVVDILNDEFRRGSIFNVEQRLKDIPTDLSKLFEDTLLRDNTRREHLLLCIQWVLFAKRPLRLEEFYFAMAAGLATECPREWDPDYISVEDMKRYVSDSSKGLVKLTKSRSPTVQFIHESVRDFLLKDGGLCKLWPELDTNLHSLSHRQLSKCCQRSLAFDLTPYKPSQEKQQSSAQEIHQFRTEMNQRMPFLGYAANYVFHHANEMAMSTATDDLLAKFDIQKWILIYNSLGIRPNRRLTPNAPLHYIFATQNTAWLMREILQLDATIPSSPHEDCRHPLLAAIANRFWEVVRAMLEPSHYPGLDDVMSALKRLKNVSVETDSCPLYWSIQKRCVPLAEMLIVSSLADLDFNNEGQTFLSLAAEKGLETIVHHLLLRHAVDSPTRTALYVAAEKGHDKVVKLLLNRGADADSLKHRYHDTTMLYAASRGGHEQVVRLLLDAGAEVNAQGGLYGSALQAAASKGSRDIVQLLLDKGADVNVQGGYYGNALQAAASKGSRDIVQLLLDRGADVNAQGGEYGNALKAALECGDWGVARLLRTAGAKIDFEHSKFVELQLCFPAQSAM